MSDQQREEQPAGEAAGAGGGSADEAPGVSLKEIGRRLKHRRKQLGLTIVQVQESTKIRSKYLEAIEEGDEDAIPGVVYARGFVRSYAQRLGLDGYELMRLYRLRTEYEQGQKKRLGKVDVKPPMAPAKSSHLTTPDRTRRGSSPLTMWAGIVVTVLALTWGAGQWLLADPADAPGENGTDNGEHAVNGPLVPGNGDDPGDDGNGDDDENGTDEPDNGDDEPGDPDDEEPAEPEVARTGDGQNITYTVATDAEELTAIIRADGGNSWLGNIAVDGETYDPSQLTLQDGDSLEFTFTEELRIRVGNPPVTYVEILGADQGSVDSVGPRNILIQPGDVDA